MEQMTKFERVLETQTNKNVVEPRLPIVCSEAFLRGRKLYLNSFTSVYRACLDFRKRCVRKGI